MSCIQKVKNAAGNSFQKAKDFCGYPQVADLPITSPKVEAFAQHLYRDYLIQEDFGVFSWDQLTEAERKPWRRYALRMVERSS